MKFLYDADRQHRDRLSKAGKFPKPVKPGNHANGANAWIDTEIDTYQQRCVADRDAREANKPT
jgi:predicted DNA-binding transcriptional regulator AlpA